MAGPRKKKSAKARKSKKSTPAKNSREEIDQLRRGMPGLDSVRAVEDFVSPENVKYKILKTTEMDAYDLVPTPRPKRKKGSR